MLVELVKEFADEAHLPFDAAGCLAQMRDTVADIRTHCGDDFDFAPVERALEELDKALPCCGSACQGPPAVVPLRPLPLLNKEHAKRAAVL